MKVTLLIGGACVGAAFLGYLAYRAVGWIGVGVLGLLIAFIAFRLELEQDAPVGHQYNTGLYAETLRGREQMSRAERAAVRAEIGARLRAGNVAKAIGAVLAIAGLGGFFVFQLPS